MIEFLTALGHTCIGIAQGVLYLGLLVAIPGIMLLAIWGAGKAIEKIRG